MTIKSQTNLHLSKVSRFLQFHTGAVSLHSNNTRKTAKFATFQMEPRLLNNDWLWKLHRSVCTTVYRELLWDRILKHGQEKERRIDFKVSTCLFMELRDEFSSVLIKAILHFQWLLALTLTRVHTHMRAHTHTECVCVAASSNRKCALKHDSSGGESPRAAPLSLA